MKYCFLCLAIFLLPISPCFADVSPSETVQQYCQLDYDGQRLSSASWPRVAHLVSWQVEPGWDMATGVTGFRITSEMVDGNSATIQVLFFAATNKTVEFTLQRNGNIWKIVSPAHQPHVSQKLLCEPVHRGWLTCRTQS